MVFRFIVGPVGDGFSQSAIQAFQLIGIDRQIVGCEIIIFAHQIAFFFTGVLRALAVSWFKGAVHAVFGVINSNSKG